jgi:hypothetical protein
MQALIRSSTNSSDVIIASAGQLFDRSQARPTIPGIDSADNTEIRYETHAIPLRLSLGQLRLAGYNIQLLDSGLLTST